MAARLTLRDLTLRFGGISVLENVSFDVDPGLIFGLVGPNGAGKTSLFNCISGHYKPSSGSILIDDEEVIGSSPSRVMDLPEPSSTPHCSSNPLCSITSCSERIRVCRVAPSPGHWDFR